MDIPAAYKYIYRGDGVGNATLEDEADLSKLEGLRDMRPLV